MTVVGLGFCLVAVGADVELMPVADTTLVEAAPDNNLGGLSFCNAGTAGDNGGRNRALFRFDLQSAVPAGARITSVQVALEVTGVPSGGGVPSVFRLHRVLQAWGEGVQAPSSAPGLGLPAVAGETTWNHRFALTTNTWTLPGGAAGLDYATTASAEAAVYGVDGSPYLFGSSTALVADVQGWVDHPESNAGWMLLSATEEVPKTARRFGAREDSVAAARLVVSFEPPLRLESIVVTNRAPQIRFRVDAGWQCRVDRSEVLPAVWTLHTNLPTAGQSGEVVVVDEPGGRSRFYRVVRVTP